MLNVTKELTALARKLGYTGKAPDTVAKAINAITSVAGENSNDNYYYITATMDDNNTVSLNKTFEEIITAMNANQMPILFFPTLDGFNIFHLTFKSEEYINFAHIQTNIISLTNVGMTTTMISVNNDNAIEFSSAYIYKSAEETVEIESEAYL